MESEPRGTTKNAGREALQNQIATHPVPGIPPPRIKGSEEPVPDGVTLDAPRLLTSAAAPLLWPVTPRAAVWRSSGAVARPRGVGGGRESRFPTEDTKTEYVLKIQTI